MTFRIVGFSRRKLEGTLRLEEPPLSRNDTNGEPFRQLGYIHRHLLFHDLKPCRSMAIEDDYVDRDYMEDHSVFYSRCFKKYSNRCRRVHFFTLTPGELRRSRRRILDFAGRRASSRFDQACIRLSERSYLGFCVVKPLSGCPVGRTVLRCYGPDSKKGHRREFGPTRTYVSHAGGLSLTVRGLAFQQQDTGVSACATTALWSSLQNQSKFEEVAAATPAQITLLASRYALPFGRSMPSEGLSLDQMSMAVQALGLAPNLIRLDKLNDAREILTSAVRSGFAPVLILSRGTLRHAVTVTGMALKTSRHRPLHLGFISEDSADLLALYVHDDRNGPYVRGDLSEIPVPEVSGAPPVSRPTLRLQLRHKSPHTVDPWRLTHALVPMHPKIRLPLSVLNALGVGICGKLRKCIISLREEGCPLRAGAEDTPTRLSVWIARAYEYLQQVSFDRSRDGGPWLRRMLEDARLSRYVGVIEIASALFGRMHILVDTTNTRVNLSLLGVVHLIESGAYAREIRSLLIDMCVERYHIADAGVKERVTWLSNLSA